MTPHIVIAVLFTTAYTVALVLTGLGIIMTLLRIVPSRMTLPLLITSAFAVGQIVIGNLLQLLALFDNGFRPLPILCLLAAGAALGVPCIVRLRASELYTSLDSARGRLPFDWKLIFVAVCGLGAMLAFTTLDAPGGDAMAFYLTQPKVIASSGTFTLLPGYESFAQIGLGSEMHFAMFYALAPELSGEHAAKFFIFPVFVSLTLTLVGIGAYAGLGPRARVILAAMVLSSTSVTFLIPDGKSDLIPALSALSAVYWSMRLREPGPVAAKAALVALLTALSIIGKLSFALAVVPVVVVVTLFALFHKAKLEGLSFVSMLLAVAPVALLAALLGVIPLVLKNGVLLHEPFAPFYMLHSPSSGILEQSWYTPENTRWIFLTYPLALVFGNYPMQHGNLSPLWLALMPLLIFLVPAWRAGNYKQLAALTGAALCGLLAWLALKASVFAPRYILPTLLALYPIVAASADDAMRSRRLPAMRVLIPLVTLLGIGITAYSLRSSITETRQYLSDVPAAWHHEYWRATRVINDGSKRGARVMVAGYYTLPLRGDLLQCMTRPQENAIVFNATASTKLWESLYALGVDWLLMQRSSHAKVFASKLDATAAPGWLKVEEIKIAELTWVYHLNVIGIAPDGRKSCVGDASGTYHVTPVPDDTKTR